MLLAKPLEIRRRVDIDRAFREIVFNLSAEIAYDNGNRGASRFSCSANGVANQAFALKRQQLFWAAEPARSARGENYGANAGHDSAGAEAGLRTMFQPWMGVLRSRNDSALASAKTA